MKRARAMRLRIERLGARTPATGPDRRPAARGSAVEVTRRPPDEGAEPILPTAADWPPGLARGDVADGPLAEAARFARKLAHRGCLPAEACEEAVRLYRGVDPVEIARALGWGGTAVLLARRQDRRR